MALQGIVNIINGVGHIVNLLIPIVMAIALLAFFWGLVDYIRHPEKGTGKQTMIAGLVSLFIMVTVWGIIIFAQQALGVTNNPKTGVAPGVVGSTY